VHLVFENKLLWRRVGVIHKLVDEPLGADEPRPELDHLARDGVEQPDVRVRGRVLQVVAHVGRSIARVEILLPKQEAARGANQCQYVWIEEVGCRIWVGASFR